MNGLEIPISCSMSQGGRPGAACMRFCMHLVNIIEKFTAIIVAENIVIISDIALACFTCVS